AHTADAVRRIYAAKNRSYGKPTGIVGNAWLHRELHILPEATMTMIDSVTRAHDLPLAVIAPFRREHPLLQAMDPFVFGNAVKGDTLNILLNAGDLRNRVAELAVSAGRLFVGSSANTSLKGSRYAVADIEAEVLGIADVVVDYGPSRYRSDDGSSSTMIDFTTFRVQRAGVCYNEIAAVLAQQFGVTLSR
ncbi:MAG: Sua5/YciO/YrdC/YwlC family protein, partial [Proteobacteria bacterium]|nr:Sua5/YciO/YrdC/YwlC family protein [Burkholderiales bacterium]